MMTPPLSVGLFTKICKDSGVEVELFETTHYADTNKNAQTNKETFGAGRKVKNYVDAFEDVKPTRQAFKDFRSHVEKYKPDLIVLSLVEDTFLEGVHLLETIRDLKIPNLVGGVFPINAPWQSIEPDVVDTICRYEGENVLRDVLHRIQANMSFNDVKGIWWKKKGIVQTNEPQPLVDVNDLEPDYSLFSDKRFYRPIGGIARKTVQLETYRGCPYSCTYCNSPTTRKMDKGFLRRKSLDTVRKEMYNLCDNFKTEYWFVIDDSFTARPKKELFDLLKIFEEFNLPWWCNTRLDDVDDEILAAMKQARCDRIQFGVESGNEQYRMNVLKRRVKQEVYLEKAEVINQSGIPYGLNAIIGMPNETRSMVLETARLCRDIGGYDGLGVSMFIPYWGTELREIAVADGYLPYNNIGSGGLQDEPIMDMPAPYLSKNDVIELSHKFKYYAFFGDEHWPEIDVASNMQPWEDEYQKRFFYSPVAVSGFERMKHYACTADPYVEF